MAPESFEFHKFIATHVTIPIQVCMLYMYYIWLYYVEQKCVKYRRQCILQYLMVTDAILVYIQSLAAKIHLSLLLLTLDLINPRRACGQRGLLYLSRVCVYVCVCVCVSVRIFLPPRASRPRNIGTYVRVHRDTEKNFYDRDFR